MPNTVKNAFEESAISSATLHVPEGSIEKYKSAEPWNDFASIVALTSTDPGMRKCATPTLKIVDGKVCFESETDGAVFKWSYSFNSGYVENEGKEATLAGTTICRISVYATKEDYQDSDIATADVELSVGKQGDVNADGNVTITDAVGVVNIILNNGAASAPALEAPEVEASEVVEPE